MSSKPLLSVIIQNYNYGHFLREAIDSILIQDYPVSEMEFIIIDDGSTDGSPQIIQEYANKHSHIKVILYKENKGTQFATNHSIDIAQGEYIHWLAADDFREKNFLSKSMKALLQHPNIGLCCSDFGYTEETTGRHHLLANRLLKSYSSPVAFYPKDLQKVFARTPFWIPGHTTIIKKESVIKFGRFNQDLKEKCDWFLLHEIALHEGVVYIPEVLAYWYMHSKSYSAQVLRSKKDRKLVTKNLLAVLRKKEYKASRTLFYKSTILAWTFWEVPLEFLRPKTFLAFPYLVKRKLRKLCVKLYTALFRRRSGELA